jgi:hypothetical protein
MALGRETHGPFGKKIFIIPNGPWCYGPQKSPHASVWPRDDRVMETASRRQTQGIVRWLICSDAITSVQRLTGS